VSVNSVNMVQSVNKVVNPHKDNYHYYVGGVPHIPITLLSRLLTDTPYMEVQKKGAECRMEYLHLREIA
jgi:hypothetical protein